MKNVMKTSKSYNYFTDIIQKDWEKLRKIPDTIFENIEYNIDINNEYNKFKESEIYDLFLHESEDYMKKKIIHNYFIDFVARPMVNKVKELSENENISIVGEMILENTELILEHNLNPVVAQAVINKKKDETTDINSIIIEEAFMDTIKTINNYTSDAIIVLSKLGGLLKYGIVDITTKPITSLIHKLTEYDAKILENIAIIKTLAKTSEPNENIVDFLKKYSNLDEKKMMYDCMSKTNLLQLYSASNNSVFQKIMDFITKTERNQLIRAFGTKNLNDIFKQFVRKINTNYEFKRLSNYRKCILNTQLDMISGLAISAFELSKIDNELLKRVKELPRADVTKLTYIYKDVYKFRPKNEAEDIFKTSILYLILLLNTYEEYSKELRSQKMANEDPYIGDDLKYMISSIKQRIAELIETFERSNKTFKSTEENYKENLKKNIKGYEDSKPKKENLFDF